MANLRSFRTPLNGVWPLLRASLTSGRDPGKKRNQYSLVKVVYGFEVRSMRKKMNMYLTHLTPSDGFPEKVDTHDKNGHPNNSGERRRDGIGVTLRCEDEVNRYV